MLSKYRQSSSRSYYNNVAATYYATTMQTQIMPRIRSAIITVTVIVFKVLMCRLDSTQLVQIQDNSRVHRF